MQYLPRLRPQIENLRPSQYTKESEDKRNIWNKPKEIWKQRLWSGLLNLLLDSGSLVILKPTLLLSLRRIRSIVREAVKTTKALLLSTTESTRVDSRNHRMVCVRNNATFDLQSAILVVRFAVRCCQQHNGYHGKKASTQPTLEPQHDSAVGLSEHCIPTKAFESSNTCNFLLVLPSYGIKLSWLSVTLPFRMDNIHYIKIMSSDFCHTTVCCV